MAAICTGPSENGRVKTWHVAKRPNKVIQGGRLRDKRGLARIWSVDTNAAFGFGSGIMNYFEGRGTVSLGSRRVLAGVGLKDRKKKGMSSAEPSTLRLLNHIYFDCRFMALHSLVFKFRCRVIYFHSIWYLTLSYIRSSVATCHNLRITCHIVVVKNFFYFSDTLLYVLI